jgi:hypothetical protein
MKELTTKLNKKTIILKNSQNALSKLEVWKPSMLNIEVKAQ